MKIQNQIPNENTLKCNFCMTNNGYYYGIISNYIYCKDCGDQFKDNPNNLENNALVELAQAREDNEKEKMKFIIIYLDIIIKIIFKVNYIIKMKILIMWVKKILLNKFNIILFPTKKIWKI